MATQPQDDNGVATPSADILEKFEEGDIVLYEGEKWKVTGTHVTEQFYTRSSHSPALKESALGPKVNIQSIDGHTGKSVHAEEVELVKDE